MAAPQDDRALALSLQLAQAHRLLRRQVAELRADIGRRRPRDDTLATHCLAFCNALTSHHRSEDDDLFSPLLHVRPDLSATIANLLEDHALIAAILSRLKALADQAADSPGAGLEAAIGREIDGLAAIMESHFRYEERAIGRALDEGVTG